MKTPTPLTTTQTNELNAFITDCVMTNRIFTLFTGKFGADTMYTIQELVNSNITSLQAIGAGLEKSIIAKTGISSEFGGDSIPFEIGGVPASDLVKVLKHIINCKLIAEHRAELEAKLRNAKYLAEQFETNADKKKKAQTALRNATLQLEKFSNNIG